MTGQRALSWPNHARAWSEWRAATKGARMHHAWIIAGKSGVGKRDFALAAARELIVHPAGPAQPDEHPDLLMLTHGPKNDKEARAQAAGKPFEIARSIRVDQIRAMQRRLTMRPTAGENRVVLIDPADDMEAGASNALLKSLEEPPDGTVFMLVTHRPARLLPTIRSRCRTLRVPMMSDDEIDAMLSDTDPAPSAAAREAAIRAAHGSFGAAVRFAQQDLAPVSGLVRNLLSRGDPDLVLRGELAQLIGVRADPARIQAVLELTQGIVAEAARDASTLAGSAALADTHAALVRLAREAPYLNFDPGLLALEIGTLLTRDAPASERTYG